MFPSTEELIKLGIAVLVGGLIGAEREFRDKAAGFRTIIFITIGATILTILSLRIGASSNPTRIAANIVTGIGFLGAGAIIRNQGRIAGLTTAATIWLAAAVGIGIGGGEYSLVVATTLFILLVLWIFPYFERWIDNIREAREYEIAVSTSSKKLETIPQIIKQCSLRGGMKKRLKADNRIISCWYIYGRPKNHEYLINALLGEKEFLEIKY